MKMKILMAIFAAGFILTHAEAQEITITTDKAEYEQGESVKLTLENKLEVSIFSHIASGTPGACIEHIERKTPAGDWERLFTRCQDPYCIYDIDAPGEMKPGESKTFEWKPLIYINGTQERIEAGPGTYRFVSLYQIREAPYPENWGWKTVRSNEFVIK
jgi:hypothetical protein